MQVEEVAVEEEEEEEMEMEKGKQENSGRRRELSSHSKEVRMKEDGQ